MQDKNSCENFTCERGFYKCHNQNYCISIELICNGIKKCFYHDDETSCGKNFFFHLFQYLNIFCFPTKKDNNFIVIGNFQCRNVKKFVKLEKVCDGIVNCLDGSDEIFCYSGNFQLENCEIRNSTEILCRWRENGIKSLNLPKPFRRLTIFGFFGNLFLENTFLLSFLRIEQCNIFLKRKRLKLFPNIFYLSIINSKLKSNDLMNIENVFKLQYLDISNNPIDNLIFISKFNSYELIYLNISFTRIKSYLYFRMLINLEFLEAKNQKLPINEIKYLTKLKYIINDCQIFFIS